MQERAGAHPQFEEYPPLVGIRFELDARQQTWPPISVGQVSRHVLRILKTCRGQSPRAFTICSRNQPGCNWGQGDGISLCSGWLKCEP